MPKVASAGRFIAIVGPSGVGKDSVMNALCEALPNAVRCRRVITRDPEAGGEDYEAVDAATFCARAELGELALWWHAHGLYYGIPVSVFSELQNGKDVLANLSRSKLLKAREIFDSFMVLSIKATPEVLEARLAARGREDAQDRIKRLARSSLALPDGLPVVEIDNSGKLEDAVAQALAALQASEFASA